MKYGNPKGTKDFLPQEQLVRKKIIDTCKDVFELYGFAPMETPGLELLEVLTSKGAGGSEIGKEIYSLKDRGGRRLGLRFDLTVPTARVLSNNKGIKMPFKRYQTGKVWRQEFGTRMREFWQCDADTIGANSTLSDVEPFLIIQEVFSRLNLKVTIKFNSRQLLSNICSAAGIPQARQMKVILILDKLEKIGAVNVKKELKKINVDPTVLDKFLNAKVSDDPELSRLSKLLKKAGVKAKFDPTLARGLDYYTGVMFEVKTKGYPSTITAGGRYDKLLSKLGDVDQPAIGVSFGIDRIYDVLKNKESMANSPAKVFIIPIRTEEESLELASTLRAEGIKTDIDLLGRSPGKSLDYAAKMGIPYVLMVGQRELDSGKFSLKDMKSGKEQKLNTKQVIRVLNG